MIFKKGDLVKRIKSNWGGINVGDIYIVAEDTKPGLNHVKLTIDSEINYRKDLFKLISSTQFSYTIY